MTIRTHTCQAALAVLLLLWNPAWALSPVFQEVYSFSPFGLDGDSPHGGLIQAKDGDVYGTTFYGGTWDYGTVFKMTLSGQITTLASLDATNSDQHPITGLLQASDGNLYCELHRDAATHVRVAERTERVLKLHSNCGRSELKQLHHAGYGVWAEWRAIPRCH